MSRLSLKEKAERAEVKLQIARMNQLTNMIESLPTFAQDPDEKDWIKFADGVKTPYSAQDLEKLRKQAQKLQYTVAGRNILSTLENYIIGKTAAITAEDENPEVQEYWDGWVIENNWDTRSRELVKRTFRDGEVFLRWFQPKDGSDYPMIRFVNPSEIKPMNGSSPSYGIETDPDDIETPVHYERIWRVNNIEKKEKIPADEIMHIKINVDSDVKRGVSFFIGVAKYMAEYEKWLADRIMLNKIRQMWAVVGEVEGVSPTDFKTQFSDVVNRTPVGGMAKKKIPRPGGVFLQKGVKWKLESLNVNAQDTKEDGRAIQLMIAIGTSLPEYVVRGDASNANYASSMVQENPFVRAMESWQDFFEKPFKTIFRRVIEHGIRTANLKKMSYRTIVDIDTISGEESKPRKEEVPTVMECQVNFCTLIHKDLEKDTKAYQMHRQNRWASDKTITGKLGYDFDDEQRELAKEDRDERERVKLDEPEFPEPGQPQENNEE